MKILKLTLLLFLTFAFIGKAQQSITQNISGTITDGDNQQPIIGALIEIKKHQLVTVTDANGNFLIPKVPIGRLDISITSMSYEPVYMRQMLLTSTKELVINIKLEEKYEELNTIELSAQENKGEVLNDMAVLSAKQFTVEETKRYPGAFNDPARMVSAYAGVSSNAEGSNEIIVRGNSPKGILWRLEGIDIPNPNHFADEGATGGPISILNADMLDNSEFYSAAFPPQYGNALSGVFDISFRKGNANNYEFSAGLGMLGLEATAEGPISKGGNNSFLINYRYSSLDLIDKLNIADFGGVPKYQDLAFNLNFRLNSGGSLSFFGLGGLSHITDQGYDNEEEQGNPVYADDFGASMGVIGVNHIQPINSKGYLKSSFSISGNTGSYSFEESLNSNPLQLTENSNISASYAKLASTYFFKKDSKDKFQVGFIITRNNYNMKDDYFDVDEQSWHSVLNAEGHSYMVQAFGGWKHQFGQRLSMVSGIHTTYFRFNGNFSIDPRLAWSYELNEKQKVGFAVGVHSKLESMSIYQGLAEDGNGNYYEPNKDLDFTKSIHFVASYDRYFNRNLHFKGEIYYQYLYDVPVGTEENSSYSILNSTSGYVDFDLQNDGFGRNYGLDLTFERYFDNDYYFLISGSVFNSEFKNPELAWRKGRFAGDYLFNALGGKDFKIAKSKPGSRTLTLSVKTTVLGGKRDYPILIDESITEERTVYDRTDPWGIKADDIFFMNFAATYRIDKAKVSHEVKLDIQNVTNNQAAIGKYYDPAEGGLVSYYQLGMFPVLSYKIYF